MRFWLRQGRSDQQKHGGSLGRAGSLGAGPHPPCVGLPAFISSLAMPPKDPGEWGEWVKLVSDHGTTIVIATIVIVLCTWAFVFTVLKLFGKSGLVPYVIDKVFGDDGYAERLVGEHTKFVQSVAATNTDTKELVKGALAVGEVHLARQKNTHEMLAGCGHDFCDALEVITTKMGMQSEIKGQVESIRERLDQHTNH